MKLPIYQGVLPKTNKTLSLNGINHSSNAKTDINDAINLTGTKHLKTRPSRKAALLLERTPDQIIPIGERLFFRYQNELQEMVADIDGTLKNKNESLRLSALSSAPDRILIIWKTKLCVLPDMIYFEQSDNLAVAELGADVDRKTAMPFLDSRTLFYTSGYSGDESCEEAYLLKVGMQLSFSWLGNLKFTIISIDRVYSNLGTAEAFEGYRVRLDIPVAGWEKIPSDGKVFYSNSRQGKLLPPSYIGKFDEINCFENRMQIYSTKENSTFFYSALSQLHPGQTVRLSGSKSPQNNGIFTIENVGKDYILFKENLFPVNEDLGTEITITPIIPDLTDAVLLEDRLVGIDKKRGLWVSAKDMPFLLHKAPLAEEDAWYCQLPVNATGITVWKDSVILFTEFAGYRLYGKDAFSYGITRLSISGLLANSSKTLCELADTAYYASSLGIMRYSGSSDNSISAALPHNMWYRSATILGAELYVLADQRLWVYNPDSSIWWSQNAEDVTDIFTVFGKLYLLTPYTIYCANGGDSGFYWRLITSNQPADLQYDVLPRKCKIKLNSASGSTISISFRAFGTKNWVPLATRTVHDETILTIPLLKTKCNGFFLKLEGYGEIEINHIELVYREV